jgi:hypothetical protein
MHVVGSSLTLLLFQVDDQIANAVLIDFGSSSCDATLNERLSNKGAVGNINMRHYQ